VGISATNRNFKGRMGSREARCYLASPAVVASSAAAGIITGPNGTDGKPLRPSIEVLTAPSREAESVEILDGFPESLSGRLVFLPQDNLNTDGIYGKDWTYRDDMTPEKMAEVLFENYDPALARSLEPGDLLVGGWNFGTGSSREQAVTALQAAKLGPVVAASFSQTYLRNAFNNGYPCVECPNLVTALRERHAAAIEAGTRTIIPGDILTVDFRHGSIQLGTKTFAFVPLGAVPQALVVAGGIENQVRRRLEGIGSERGTTR
jgi:homoaconitate hydratase